MAHVRKYMEDNYMFDLSLDSVSEILHISPAYLSAQFKKYQKMNFLDCLTELRINAAKELQVPYDLVVYVHEHKRLPVVNFAAGGVATPADAALMMQLGAEGVFVGSGIFKSGDPAKRAQAIVKAVTNFNDAEMLAELSEDLGEAMVGINEQEIQLLMAERGK